MASGSDLHEDARGNDEAIECFDGAGVWFTDIDDALVRSNLELLARLLVDEGGAIDRVDLAACRQRDRTGDAGARSLRVINDLASRGIQSLVVIRFHPNSNLHRRHDFRITPLVPIQTLGFTERSVAGHDQRRTPSKSKAQDLLIKCETAMIGPAGPLSRDAGVLSGSISGFNGAESRRQCRLFGYCAPMEPTPTRIWAALRQKSPFLAISAAFFSILLPISAAHSETLVNDSIGIQIDLPTGTLVSNRSQQGQVPFVVLRDGSEQPKWSLRLERITNNEMESTRDLLIEILGLQQDTETPLTILDQSQLTVGQLVAETAWVIKTTPEGQKLAFGTFILPLQENVWLVASTVTLPAHVESVRNDLLPTFTSIQPQDPTLLSLDREAALFNGKSLLDSITKDDLRGLVGYKALRRVHMPDASSELGYSMIEVQEAPRGAIKRRRDPSRYTEVEKEDGLLVVEHGRYVLEAERGIYIDILALQWVSWDLQREAWTIAATRRQGEARMTETEVGFRTEPSLHSPRPVLHVIKEDTEINLRKPYQWTLPEGWLPRALTSLLPQLIPHQDGAYAFITYDATGAGAEPTITTRLDTWTVDPRLTEGMTVESRIGEQGLPTRATYGRGGALIRLTKPDGSVLEPSTADSIQQLWTEAGLATD
jgi:hypothetical protein